MEGLITSYIKGFFLSTSWPLEHCSSPAIVTMEDQGYTNGHIQRIPGTPCINCGTPTLVDGLKPEGPSSQTKCLVCKRNPWVIDDSPNPGQIPPGRPTGMPPRSSATVNREPSVVPAARGSRASIGDVQGVLQEVGDRMQSATRRDAEKARKKSTIGQHNINYHTEARKITLNVQVVVAVSYADNGMFSDSLALCLYTNNK